ncbi:MAG: hypothetical protein WCB44_17075 [Stellaceae bacterium]
MKDQTAATPAVPSNLPRAPTHLVQREASDRVVAIGLRDRWLGNLYHHLLTLPCWAFLLGLAAVYLGLNILFAGLYLLGDAAIANARPGAVSDALFFQRRDHLDDRLRPDVAGDALRQHCHDRQSNVRIDPFSGIRGCGTRPILPTNGPRHG